MSLSADESTTGRHIPALDGVRGLAILLVLLLHLFVRNNRPQGGLLERGITAIFASGWVGVDIFFALSGFLITGILFDTRNTPDFFRNFYARRALRIFPLYYAFILFAVLVSTAQGYHWNPAGLLALLTYVHNLFHVWFTTARWVNLNHFWSLAIEEQFYLVWPAVVYMARTKRRIGAIALAGILLSLGMRIYEGMSGMAAVDPYIQYSWTPSRIDGLLMGALLALLIRSRVRMAVIRWAPRLLVVMLLFWMGWIVRLGFGLPDIGDPFIDTMGISLMGFTCACLVASVLRTGSVASSICSTAVLRALGRYSYGLYVYHYTLKSLLDMPVWLWASRHTDSKALPILASGLVTLATSVIAAVLSFHLFESRVLRLKNRFASHGGEPRLRSDVEAMNTGRG